MKKMNIKEFRELGYLQEANRQFFHPLGLALEITIDEQGNEQISGVWDYREDEEGIIYDLANSDRERIERFKANAEYVKAEFDKRHSKRIEILGNVVEPYEKGQ